MIPTGTMKKKSLSEDMETLDPFSTVGGKVKWGRHCGPQYGISSKIKNRTTI